MTKNTYAAILNKRVSGKYFGIIGNKIMYQLKRGN